MPLKHEALSGIALFAGLSESEIQALAQRAVERRFAADEMLFWEGEPCTGIFLLTQGSAKIFKTSAAGREMMLSLETAPVQRGRTAAIRRRTLSGVGSRGGAGGGAVHQQERFPPGLPAVPGRGVEAAGGGGRRLRHLVGVVESMTFGSVTQRLARILLDISRQAGADEFDLTLTHQELASRLGTVREVVSRNLARFRAEGVVQIQGHQLRILDRASLEREAEAQG
jgi:CRP-like cAMP-binding protein